MATALSRLFLRRRTLLAGAAAAIGLGGASGALAQPNLVDMTVVNRDTGQPLHTWRRHGRLFVAGEPGTRYALRVSNHTGGRVLVVMSVDGVNILTGETAGYDQRGYVFSPYETSDLTGWRKSNSEIAAFVFAPLPQSYAARTGRPVDIGVIGIAAFREKVVPVAPPVQAPPMTSRDSAVADGIYGSGGVPEPTLAHSAASAWRYGSSMGDIAGGAKAQPCGGVARQARGRNRRHRLAHSRAGGKLGTAHGASGPSSDVAFDRATAYPQSVQQIEYDTYDNLVIRGVIPRAGATHLPRPFPARPEEQGYVPDPPPEL